jgi:hypothetical protein
MADLQIRAHIQQYILHLKMSEVKDGSDLSFVEKHRVLKGEHYLMKVNDQREKRREKR